MLVRYDSIKSRWQFGKQCLFQKSDSIVVQNILPQPKLMQNYVHSLYFDRSVQKSQQFALHEMQTITKEKVTTGMFHLEGGWPKDVDPTNEEVVKRFRRRVEKDENWVPSIKQLTGPMEHYIMQNNIIDIYENYFDNMVPTELTLPRNVRIVNVYSDPQPIVRPVNHLSWSPATKNQFAASYCFPEFEVKPTGLNPWSYIWDIENAIAPVIKLTSPSPLIMTDFNPRDPLMLMSGMMTGQVCNWDIRIGNRPVQTSHRRYSHRNPANQAHWITSKTNTEFFSGSTDGTIKWWDTRNLKQPIEELLLDLDRPRKPDKTKLIGLTALQCEPLVTTRFLAGLENGIVINVNRKTTNPVEKLAARFHCHAGPIIAVERNPVALRNFLTVGDWNIKIWADDNKEDDLIVICDQDANLSSGCWSKTRCSVFFTINTAGILKVYDILVGVDPTSVGVFQICEDRLTAITPNHHDLLAIGSYKGNTYLVQCSEGYTVFTKTDKAHLISYLERCNHFEKNVETRMKEIYRMNEITMTPVHRLGLDFKPTKKWSRRLSRRLSKPIKGKESRYTKEILDPRFYEDVKVVEKGFLQDVKNNIMGYQNLDIDQKILATLNGLLKKKKKDEHELVKEFWETFAADAAEIAQERKLKRKKEKDEERRREIANAAIYKEKKHRKKSFCVFKVKLRKPKVRKAKICQTKVCKPKVCCADLEKIRKTILQDHAACSKSVDYVEKLPEPLTMGKKIPKDTCILANVLADEVKKAKREVRVWHETIASRKSDVRRARMISAALRGKLHRKTRKATGGSLPGQKATEDRSNFWQLVETSAEAKDKSEAKDEDKIPQEQEQEKRQE